MKIRLAKPDDIKAIMLVEKETFGNLAASKKIMKNRIILCNEKDPGWFWLAEEEGVVFGYMILQPTKMKPDECFSWFGATDDGKLEKTFDRQGKNVYVVSLACSDRAPENTSALLCHTSFVYWSRHGGLYMFCSRMPGFRNANKKIGISAQDYWQLRNEDGGPFDSMMRLYWGLTGGFLPYKLLENGYIVDKESGGHGVLFVIDDPVPGLLSMANYLFDKSFVIKK
jgi:hypothetical protein